MEQFKPPGNQIQVAHRKGVEGACEYRYFLFLLHGYKIEKSRS